MRMVENHPSMVMLAGIGVLAHIEPADAARQHQQCPERGSRHHFRDALSSNPLQPHQQRELALHGGSQRQRMAQELQHRLRRSWLSSLARSLAIGRVGNDATAFGWNASAREEIHARGAEPTVGDVRRDHAVAVRREHRGDRASAAAGLSDRAMEADMPEQRFGHPGGRGVKVAALPIVVGRVDGAIFGRPR
jgi:hypothetical protein